jgi:hypothetical protein
MQGGHKPDLHSVTTKFLNWCYYRNATNSINSACGRDEYWNFSGGTACKADSLTAIYEPTV